MLQYKQEVIQIGPTIWTQDEIRDSIPEFIRLYSTRPWTNNDGGMKAPHMFATWFMLKKLNPTTVIESGVWKGYGTWLIEKAAPKAELNCIDINLGLREYISPKANYYEKDFSKIAWSHVEDKSNALLFFDDHQNALSRIKQGRKIGFEQFIFEDNYPAQQGDFYSLKKAFQHAGFISKENRQPLSIRDLFRMKKRTNISPNKDDAKFLKSILSRYSEFPPVVKPKLTRWGDLWVDEIYPTKYPLFQTPSECKYDIFVEEAMYYTWICYAKL